MENRDFVHQIHKYMKQKGFIAQILLIALLIAGVGIGSYLIKQRTNILPQAQERTVACDGQTLNSQSTESQNAFRAAYGEGAPAEWVRQHEQELADKGTPCGSGKAEGGNCSLSNKDSISSSCANEIDDKNPGFMASIEGSNKNTCTRAQIISHWCASNPSECNAKKQSASSCGGTSGGGGAGAGGSNPANQSCNLESTKQTYFDAKVANRYARFVAIMRGIPEYCVQADLGLAPGIRDASGDGSIPDGRLYLCSGEGSSPEKLDLVWRIISDDGRDIAASKRHDPRSNKQNVKEVMFSYVQQAETKLSISPSMIQW